MAMHNQVSNRACWINISSYDHEKEDEHKPSTKDKLEIAKSLKVWKEGTKSYITHSQLYKEGY